MKPINYQLPNNRPVSGINPMNPIRQFGGLSMYDPLTLPDNEFVAVSNMDTHNYPAMSTMRSLELIYDGNSRIIGLGNYQDKELHYITANGLWRRYNGYASADVTSGLSTSDDYYFTSFEGNWSRVKLILCNGYSTMRTWDGSSSSTLSAAPSNGKYITTYANRLWCIVDNELWGSNLDNAEQWNDFSTTQNASFRRQIESTKGEKVSMLTGSLAKLTLGMPGSLQEMYGQLPRDFSIRLVTEDVGFVNNKCNVTQDGFMRFMHKFGIYEYGGGTLPNKNFSDKIGKLMDQIDDRACAGTDGRFLYFRYAPYKTLVYDSRGGINAWSMMESIDPTFFQVFQNNMYIGTSDGKIFKVVGDSGLIGNSEISWSCTTKPFNASSAGQNNNWYKIFITLEFRGTVNIDVTENINALEGPFTRVATYQSSTKNTVNRRVIIPLRQFARNPWISLRISGTGICKIHEITPQTRTLNLY